MVDNLLEKISELPDYVYYCGIAVIALTGVLIILTTYRIFKKGGKPVILCIIPIVNIIAAIVVSSKLKRQEKMQTVEPTKNVESVQPINSVNPALNSVNIPDAAQVQSMVEEKEGQNTFGFQQQSNNGGSNMQNNEQNITNNAFDFKPIQPTNINDMQTPAAPVENPFGAPSVEPTPATPVENPFGAPTTQENNTIPDPFGILNNFNQNQ